MAEKTIAVLLPGMDGTGELFAEFAAAGPPSFEPIVISYPTDEFLPYADLVELVAARLPVDRKFILVAESFSGPVALTVGAEPRPGLAGVILCNSFVRSPVGTGLRLLPWSLLARLPAPVALLRRALLDPASSESLLRSVRQSIRRVRPSVLAARMNAVFDLNAQDALSDCSVPVGYLRADDDRLVPGSSLDLIREVRPDVTVARLAGPHLLLQARPKEAWEAVAALAKTLPT